MDSLATVRPQDASWWHPEKNGTLNPSDVTPNSHKKVWWQCPIIEAHVWEESVKDNLRPKKGGRCPYCDYRKALPGETDMGTTHSDLAVQWHVEKNVVSPQGLDGSQQSKGSLAGTMRT